MKQLILSLLLVIGLSSGVEARGFGSFTSQAPHIVTNCNLNLGVFTRSGQGGVNLDTCLYRSSPPVKSWTLSETDAVKASGYFQTGCGGTNSTVAASPSTTTLNEKCNITTVLFVSSEGRGGYSANDFLCLSNGMQVTVNTVTNDNNTGVTKIINTFTINVGTPTATVIGPSAVKIVPILGSCQSSTTGTGAAFTAISQNNAQTPFPNGTGATNNLGYSSLPSTVQRAGRTFSIGATGLDNSTATAGILNYNIIPDAVNFSGTGLTTRTASILNTSFGAGATNTLQAFVNACVNCSGTTGDLKLLFSTGGIYSNPNIGPNFDTAYKLAIGPNINPGSAINTQGTFTAGTTNELTIEDACRATGNSTSDSNLFLCTGVDGNLSTFDQFNLTGDSSPTSTATECTKSASGNALSGMTWVRLEGITFSGSQNYNYYATTQIGSNVAGACDIYRSRILFLYPTQFDANNNFISPANGGQLSGLGLDIASGSTVFDDHIECWSIGGCFQDGVSSTNSAIWSNDTVNDLYVENFTNNAITLANSTITMTDYYLYAQQVANLTAPHNDYVQLDNLDTPIGNLFQRGIMFNAHGGAGSDGFFLGNCGTGFNPPQGFKVNGLFIANNSFVGAANVQCMDSVTSTQAETFATTSLRHIAFTPTNGGNPLISEFKMNSNPTDGQSFSIGIGCTPAPGCYAHTTVSSGTYNSGTGAISLTVAVNESVTTGQYFTLSSMSGTGSISSLNGTFVATSGTSGTTINFTGPTGLTLTISGGNIQFNQPLYKINFCTTIGSGACTGVSSASSVLIGAAASNTFQNLQTAMGVSPDGGTCGASPVTALQSDMVSFSNANGGPSNWFACFQTSYVFGSTTQVNINLSVSAQLTGTYSFCGLLETNGTLCSTGPFQSQFSFVQNIYAEQLPIQTLYPTGPTNPSGQSFSIANALNVGSSCAALVHFYCGQYQVDTNFVWDFVTTGTGNIFTNAAVISALNATNWNWTTDNYIAGIDSRCTIYGGATVCSPTGIFQGDTGFTNGAEGCLEQYTVAQWRVATPAQKTAMVVGCAMPQFSGPLDHTGTSGKWIGSFDSTTCTLNGTTITEWNEGSTKCPGWDFDGVGGLAYLH